MPDVGTPSDSHSSLIHCGYKNDFFNDKCFIRKGLGLIRCHHKVTKPQKIREIQNERLHCVTQPTCLPISITWGNRRQTEYG